VFPHRYFPA